MKKVVVQGLGFVGIAMSVAIASAKNNKGKNLYKVIGLDLPNKEGSRKVFDINNGKIPISSGDKILENAFNKCIKEKTLKASTNPLVISDADYVIVDINLDIDNIYSEANINFDGFSKAITTIGDYISEDALVIIETTVPPGTTEKIVYPILQERLQKRFSSSTEPLLAHSYERVMPGPNYYNSITNFWRVYSGCNKESSSKCRNFLETIINTKEFKMIELKNPAASETAKILENSYRSLNIAFIDEWNKFSEIIKVDLFEIIDAIRCRPTHKNIMEPGLGVGGYCLTKDPLMGSISLKQIYREKLEFPLSNLSIKINKEMPKNTLKMIKNNMINYRKEKILVLGLTYREDIGDKRFSPSEDLISMLIKENINVDCHDPLVSKTNCKEANFIKDLPLSNDYSIIVLTVKHSEFKNINYENWLNNFKGILIDANHVLKTSQIERLQSIGLKIKGIGRGNL